MEMEGLLLPRGCRIYKEQGFDMLDNGKGEFNIQNRDFLFIDEIFSGAISGRINKMIESSPVGKIQILDLAGGMNSQAVKDIEKNPKYEGKVRAYNLDIVQSVEKGKYAHRVQGDALKIPFADSSMDIVYSFQFLPFIKRFTFEHNREVKKVLAEVARVLKPGGIAFLDDEEELSAPKMEVKRQKLANELLVDFETYDNTRKHPIRGFFAGIWNTNSKPQKFLVMKKPEEIG